MSAENTNEGVHTDRFDCPWSCQLNKYAKWFSGRLWFRARVGTAQIINVIWVCMAHIIHWGREGKSSEASRPHDFITWTFASVCDAACQAYAYCKLVKMMTGITFMMFMAQRWLLFILCFYQSACLYLAGKQILFLSKARLIERPEEKFLNIWEKLGWPQETCGWMPGDILPFCHRVCLVYAQFFLSWMGPKGQECTSALRL